MSSSISLRQWLSLASVHTPPAKDMYNKAQVRLKRRSRVAQRVQLCESNQKPQSWHSAEGCKRVAGTEVQKRNARKQLLPSAGGASITEHFAFFL